MDGAAKQRYTALSPARNVFLLRAIDCAKLTIPSMLPPLGHSGTTKLPTPWQALGARCVNTLAAKLLLSLFPPSATFFKLTVDDFALEKLTQGSDAKRGDVEKALNKIERAVCAEIETKAMRPPLFEALKHLINSGNILCYLPEDEDDGAMRVYRLDSYVVKRDPSGTLLEIVTKEMVSPMELQEDHVKLLAVSTESDKSGEDTLELYTHVKREKNQWTVYQEINGQRLPGTEGSYPLDKSPWLALRLTAIDNEDYGRGLVEEYLGDLKSLEALTKAITQGAAAAAKVLFLVKPNGTTKVKTISSAESGACKEGNAEDVSVLQVDKYADFKIAFELRNSLKEGLSFAFLLNSAIQRNGERVTAEEIRYMAQELESGLGGIYSNLSQELQLPLVVVLMDRLQKRNKLPQLPKKLVKPAITTGLDAIGRGNDSQRLSEFLGDLAQIDPKGGIVQRNINEPELVKRLGVGRGIDMDGLVKDQAQIEQEAQQAQQQAMLQQLGPNAVNKLGDLAKQHLQNQGAAAAGNAPTQ